MFKAPVIKFSTFGSNLVMIGVSLYLMHVVGAHFGYPHILSQMFGWMPPALWNLTKEGAQWVFSHL